MFKGIGNALSILAFSLLLLNTFSEPPQNPIIGVYTQWAEQPYNKTQYSTYIAASYVKNLQMAGMQVIPLFFHLTTKQLDTILPKINGVFFPGGQMPIHKSTQWTQNTNYIMEYAMKEKLAGRLFPIWATCLGYEALMYLTCHNDDNSTVLTQVFGENGSTRAQTVYSNDSIIFKSLSPKQYQQATTGQGIMYYHHTWAVLKSTFDKSDALKGFWKLISTSKTPDGTQFVATVQAKDYPIYGTQYHPEKNSYQWRIPSLKTYVSVSAQQHVINAYAAVAKQNKNKFPIQELKQKIIYNYDPIFPDLSVSFTSIYLFEEDKEIKRLYGYFGVDEQGYMLTRQ